MSIAVAIEDLADEVTKRGPGYLLTTVADGRPHVMHLAFTIDTTGTGAELRAPIGRSATANIGTQSAVTLLWPPEVDGGYSLIVDGEAVVVDVDGTPTAAVTAIGAVLHRPA